MDNKLIIEIIGRDLDGIVKVDCSYLCVRAPTFNNLQTSSDCNFNNLFSRNILLDFLFGFLLFCLLISLS